MGKMRTPGHLVTGHKKVIREGAGQAPEYVVGRATEVFTAIDNVLYVSSAVLHLSETQADPLHESKAPDTSAQAVQRAGTVGLYTEMSPVAEARAAIEAAGV